MNIAIKVVAVVGVVGLGFSSTTVRAQPTVSREASAITQKQMRDDTWTWTDFGGQVVGWAAGGAAGGAVTAALVGSPVGAAACAAAGGVAGAVSGGAYYAGTQAWNYMIGSAQQPVATIAPLSALD
ncbi:hypothetical protein [Myxococcus sp. Y35]|uniref:hypothetical protein n=1 Tax=Pseudomyxococcus flavus TaxID=3115648 RepID=UPI003CE75F06